MERKEILPEVKDFYKNKLFQNNDNSEPNFNDGNSKSNVRKLVPYQSYENEGPSSRNKISDSLKMKKSVGVDGFPSEF